MIKDKRMSIVIMGNLTIMKNLLLRAICNSQQVSIKAIFSKEKNMEKESIFTNATLNMKDSMLMVLNKGKGRSFWLIKMKLSMKEDLKMDCQMEKD